MILQFILVSLLLIVGITYILKSRGVRHSYLWFLMAAVVFAAWLLLLFIPVENIRPIQIDPWFRVSGESVSLSYSINSGNWELVFFLIGMLLTFLMTASVELSSSDRFLLWALVIFLFAAVILSVSADTLWSLVLGWTLLDFLIISGQILFGGPEIRLSAILNKSVFKLMGSVFLLGATAYYSGGRLDLNIDEIPGNAQTLLFTASLLHAGIFPVALKEPKEDGSLDFLDEIFILISFTASFSYFIRTSEFQIGLYPRIFTSIFFSLLSLVFSISWAREENRKISILDMIAAGSLIVFFFLLREEIVFIKFWLIYVMSSVWFMVCYRISNRLLNIFPTLLIILTSMLPFTLLTIGVRTISFQRLDLLFIVLYVSQIMMHSGLIRKIYTESGNFFELDTWLQTMYSLGLFFFIFSISALVFRNLGSLTDEISNWAFGFSAFFFSVITTIVLIRLDRQKDLSFENTKISSLLYEILSFKWLFKFISFLEVRLSNIFIGLSGLLEGEGGILWSLVLIILLISILRFS